MCWYGIGQMEGFSQVLSAPCLLDFWIIDVQQSHNEVKMGERLLCYGTDGWKDAQ